MQLLTLRASTPTLGEYDEGDPAQYRPGESPVARARPLRADQTAILIEAQGGASNSPPTRDLSDRHQMGHPKKEPQLLVDFKGT